MTPPRRRALLTAAVATLAFTAALAAQVEPGCGGAADAAAAGRIRAYVAPLAEAGQLSGTLLVARGACVVLEESYGMASHERGVPNTPSTLFAVGSITKPLTEILAEALARRGMVRMTDPVSRWIPGFPRGDLITLGHLRRHLSGLPAHAVPPERQHLPHTADEVARLAAAAPPSAEPGAEYVYTSAGYSVLARIFEIAAGEPYHALLREHVFAPAGAEHAADATSLPPDAPRADGYLGGAEGPVPAGSAELSYLVGGGSVWATPRDLFHIVRALLDGAHGPGTKAALVRWGPSAAAQEGDSVAWGGLIGGYRAWVSHDPATGVTLVFTGNLLTGAVRWAQLDLPKVAAGEPVPARTPPRVRRFDVDAEARRRLEGRYDAGGGRVWELRFTTPSTAVLGEMTLVATGEAELFSPAYYTEVRAVIGPGGTVEALEWRLEGAAGRWPRVGAPGER